MIETSRLYTRPFTQADLPLIKSLHENKTVMHLVGHGAHSPEESKQALINIIAHQDTYGYSAWALFTKDTDTFIGRAGIVHIGTLIKSKYLVDPTLVEIGYILKESAWGLGYATEISLAVIHWAFTHTSLSTLYAKTAAANTASQRILKKLGLHFLNTISIENREGFLFKIDKKDYLETASK
jgi:[ribosomal protein S5]-alanine N-acetyltransferase